MILSSLVFVLSWTCFVLFARKSRYFEFASTCYIALILGLTSDLITAYYPLWDYPSQSGFMDVMIHLIHDFGVYFVTVYLFLQTLPAKESFLSLAKHIFLWSLFTIALEFVFVVTKNMIYGFWWNIGYSYLADWFLFIIFYCHYYLHTRNLRT
jgi:hypothetical protein